MLSAFARLATPVWIVDVERRALVWANGSALRLWGAADLAELRERAWRDLPDALRDGLSQSLAAFRRGERDGAPRTVQVHATAPAAVCVFSPVPLDGGRTGVLVEAGPPAAGTLDPTGATGRQDLESGLRASQEALFGALSLSPVPILITRYPDGVILFLNERARDLFGFPETEGAAVGTSMIATYVEPMERQRFLARVRERGVVNGFEVRMRASDGRAFWASVSASLLPYRGVPACVACIIDIDAAKESEAALQLALEQQRRINRVQRQFVSIASHDFRTPLTIIDAAAQRVQRRVGRIPPDELAERMGHIRAAVGRMSAVVDSTLEAARFDEGHVQFAPRPFDLRQLLVDASRRQEDVATRHRILCDVSDLPERVVGDPDLLERVFTNLLSNAVKYAPDAPLIEVRGGTEGGGVVVSVTDQGLGVPEAEKAHLFERFFRTSRTAGIAGTGIGLSVVKQVVDLHGGEIRVDSAEGLGTTFTVRLPQGGR